MSPKWALKRPILVTFLIMSLRLLIRGENFHIFMKPLDFTILRRMDHLTESKHRKMIFFVYFLNIYKNPSVRFWCYRVYILVCHDDREISKIVYMLPIAPQVFNYIYLKETSVPCESQETDSTNSHL